MPDIIEPPPPPPLPPDSSEEGDERDDDESAEQPPEGAEDADAGGAEGVSSSDIEVDATPGAEREPPDQAVGGSVYGSQKHMLMLRQQAAIVSHERDALGLAEDVRAEAAARVKACKANLAEAYCRLHELVSPVRRVDKSGQHNLLHDDHDGAADAPGADNGAEPSDTLSESDAKAVGEVVDSMLSRMMATRARSSGEDLLKPMYGAKLSDLAGKRKFPARAVAPLHMNKITTLGELLTKMRKGDGHGDAPWWTGFKGIGETLGDAIADAVMAMYKAIIEEGKREAEKPETDDEGEGEE